MKFQTILSFELKYQLRSIATWIYLAIAFLFPIGLSSIGNPSGGTNQNAPSLLIFVTVFGGIIWLLMAVAIAGHAAARDIQTRMHSLTYSVPVSKPEYLGGRFLAAFLINALTLLAIPAGFLVVNYAPGLHPEPMGPFRLAAYLTTYFYLGLPLAFIASAFQFSLSILERRAIAGFIASILLFPVISQFIGTTVANLAGNWDLAKLIDLVGISIIADMETWTLFEKNTRLVRLEGPFLYSRILWLIGAMLFLAFTYSRFQFAHPVASSWWIRFKRKRNVNNPASAVTARQEKINIAIPLAKPVFGFSSQLHQVRAIAWSSFGMILKSKAGVTVMGLFAVHLVIFGGEYLKLRGVPQYPTTVNVLSLLVAPIYNTKTTLILIPILLIFYAGELVWREREAGLNKIADSVPVPEWALFTGKLGGLGLIILVWLFFLLAAGLLVQVSLDYSHFEIGLYLQVLFGIQFCNYLLFVVLALVVHVVVNQKYLGHLVMLLIYLSFVFAGKLGIEHNLFIYNSDAGFSYTDMRGFAPYLQPWLWFKLYWMAWALLLAVVARLFWVRSLAQGLPGRIQLIRQRFTRPTAWVAGLAMVLMLLTGSYIFYNTNVLNKYTTASENIARLARYEQKYQQYKNIHQPRLVGTKLHVELYPAQQRAEIRGTYFLVNKNKAPISVIHLAPVPGVQTEKISFNQPASQVLKDQELGHHTYRLKNPMPPGDSLNLNFTVIIAAEGFPNKISGTPVLPNGTYFINYNWLPAIGYQANRELRNITDRQKYGLAPKNYPALLDTAARQVMPGQELITLEAVVGTDKGQIAVGPGNLLHQWTKGKRSYFHYATSAPIRNNYSFFSARYATQRVTWKNPEAGAGQAVDIRFYYHPGHAQNLSRIIKSVQASLRYFTKKFGPYPYSHLTILERSGLPGELNAEPTTIDYGESFTLSNQEDNPWALEIVYFALAHEVAHQWWGAAQLIPAHAEGGIVLSETLANYSALKVLEETYGEEQVQKLLRMWRDSYEVPRTRFGAPLLRATDAFMGYRKGPLALYALMKYTGKDRINEALLPLITKHGAGTPPLPTALDLYRELQTVTPDSLKYLLQDYFEKNIYWQLKTEQVTAQEIKLGKWEVTLNLEAEKVIVDSTGAEIPVPMHDWVEIGIFAPWEKGKNPVKPLYLQKHLIRSGKQKIKLTVPGKPARAGIDPNYLLIDLDLENNTKKIKQAGAEEEPEGLI